jgi:hypothetical protein
MIARHGDRVEARLWECSLYDPPFDLAVEDADGNVADCALFRRDDRTAVGPLKSMPVEDGYRRRARHTVCSPLACTGLGT